MQNKDKQMEKSRIRISKNNSSESFILEVEFPWAIFGTYLKFPTRILSKFIHKLFLPRIILIFMTD
jgi:hypothetical protein